MSSSEPNLSFGSPTIFFDSHPSEQESYLYSYWSSLKSTLRIALTGEVPKFHHPGTLRIIWYTHDGNVGMKDYELHEHAQVRDNFDLLLGMEEVRRVVVWGYSGQNPYVIGSEGRNPWVDRAEKEKRQKREEKEEKNKETMDNSKEGRTGTLVDIEEVIKRHDKAEEERRREEEEKIWKENEGLLNGQMV
jgi:hypothetical protein